MITNVNICNETWTLETRPDRTVTLTRQATGERFELMNVIAALGKAMDTSCKPNVTRQCLGCEDGNQ